MKQIRNDQPFDDLRVLVRLIDAFEAGTLPAAEWNHRAHLAVAAWYLIHFSETEATRRTIDGILNYNRAQGIGVTPHGGYHETLTLFWLALVRHWLANCPARRLLTKVNSVIAAYGDRKGLYLEYYTKERVMSATARNCWVPPNCKPLPEKPSRTASHKPAGAQ